MQLREQENYREIIPYLSGGEPGSLRDTTRQQASRLLAAGEAATDRALRGEAIKKYLSAETQKSGE